MLTPAHYDHYWTRGWVVVENVFDHAIVDAMAQLALDHIQSRLSAGEVNKTSAELSSDGKVLAPRKLDHPFLKDQKFRDFVFNGPLPQLVAQLLGHAPLLYMDQIFFKPPRHGSPKAYHQDNDYFRCHPDDQVLTAWIALDDVDLANGCLRYIEGSHRGPILPSKPVPGIEHDLTPDPALIDLTREAPAPVRKGGVVFHHSKTLHASGANTTDRWRRAHATHWVTANVEFENEATGRRAYYLTPEYPHSAVTRG